MQNKLKEILVKDYNICELEILLHINKNKLKKMFKWYKIYKEGYRKEDIILKLMGGKNIYSSYMLEEYDDFIPLIVGYNEACTFSVHASLLWLCYFMPFH